MEPQNKNIFSRIDFKKNWPFIAIGLAIILIGVGTSWFISTRLINQTSSGEAAPGVKVTSTEAGVLDPSVKYDTAQGVVQEGGLNGEGTFHLVRDGGPSDYVYLTSSVLDLSNFVNKKVQIWGETLASKKVGWLMDVAKVQVTQ
ncbi:MAG: hypothetical protein ABSC49_01780 [Candidatus Microgenomates bacterium]|jgi:hypothetical protein